MEADWVKITTSLMREIAQLRPDEAPVPSPDTVRAWSKAIAYMDIPAPIWEDVPVHWSIHRKSYGRRINQNDLYESALEVLQLWKADPAKKGRLAEYWYAVNRQRFIDQGMTGERLASQLLGQQINLHVNEDGKYVGPGGSDRPVNQVGRDRIRAILSGEATS